MSAVRSKRWGAITVGTLYMTAAAAASMCPQGGPLDLTSHRLLGGWAADCAAHVLSAPAEGTVLGDRRPRVGRS